MKKVLIIIPLIFLMIITSCTKQEKVNPLVFIDRLTYNYPEFTVNENDFYRESNNYICFMRDKNNSEFLIKIYTDSDKNIKKICLACGSAEKTDSFKFVSEAIIKTYAPQEDTELIIKSVFKNERDYYNSQWYRYTSSVFEGTLFFSVENMKLSTESDAELTLKENDITLRE